MCERLVAALLISALSLNSTAITAKTNAQTSEPEPQETAAVQLIEAAAQATKAGDQTKAIGSLNGSNIGNIKGGSVRNAAAVLFFGFYDLAS